jgi:hypothetical protein
MLYLVEKLRQVAVYDPLVSCYHVVFHLTHGILCSSPGSKTVAVLRKRRVDVRLNRLQYCLLDQPVHHRRYPELTLSAIRLRYLHPEHGLRLVSALEQCPLDLQPAFA